MSGVRSVAGNLRSSPAVSPCAPRLCGNTQTGCSAKCCRQGQKRGEPEADAVPDATAGAAVVAPAAKRGRSEGAEAVAVPPQARPDLGLSQSRRVQRRLFASCAHSSNCSWPPAAFLPPAPSSLLFSPNPAVANPAGPSAGCGGERAGRGRKGRRRATSGADGTAGQCSVCNPASCLPLHHVACACASHAHAGRLNQCPWTCSPTFSRSRRSWRRRWRRAPCLAWCPR